MKKYFEPIMRALEDHIGNIVHIVAQQDHKKPFFLIILQVLELVVRQHSIQVFEFETVYDSKLFT